MSARIKDGGPAFPSHGAMGEVTHEGMTMRDYFAAKAPPVPDDFEWFEVKVVEWLEGMYRPILRREPSIDRLIRWRWHYAAAMLRTREAQP